MRLNKVDLNLFVVFEAIYRERSVTKVATILNITQPAVSNALSRLRQTFDDPLFVHSQTGMNPTPLADKVIGDVRQALHLLGNSVNTNVQFEAKESQKQFRLAMNDVTSSFLLPKIYAALKAQAPLATLSNFYISREIATEDLKAGRIDLLIDSPMVNAKDLGQMPIGHFPYVVAMRKQHPLAKMATRTKKSKPATTIGLEDYLNSSHIHVSSRRSGRGHVDVALHAAGLHRTVDARLQSYLNAADLAQQIDILLTAPKVLFADTNLLTLPPPINVEPLVCNAYWSKSNDNDPAVTWLCGLITDLL